MNGEAQAPPGAKELLSEQLLKLPQVAEIMNVSLRTVDALIRSEELPSLRIRGNRRVAPADLKAYLEAARADRTPALGEAHAKAARQPRGSRQRISP